MAYNEKLADRVRELIAAEEDDVEEKKMFSGMCFMVNDKMCVCIRAESIMVRLDPAILDEALTKDGASPMIMSGRIMKGFVNVDTEAVTTQKQLEYWVGLALRFNEFAQSSKSKSSKSRSPSPKKPPAAKKSRRHS